MKAGEMEQEVTGGNGGKGEEKKLWSRSWRGHGPE
jgi:hypothetical protein